LESEKEKDEKTRDVIGSGTTTGTGIIIGKNIKVGDININSLNQNLNSIHNEYAQSLKDFAQKINQQVEEQKISEEQAKPILASIDVVVQEVKDIKKGQEEKDIDYDKQLNVESKLYRVIDNVLTVLPEWTETITGFTPLAPFSKLIGKSVGKIVETIQKKRKS
jgi:hypothetical protein